MNAALDVTACNVTAALDMQVGKAYIILNTDI
jgi:hypothetical protein